MAVHSIIFGNDRGQPVRLFTLSNAQGMQVSITNYGATITKILVPAKSGEVIQIACGFDSLAEYLSEKYLSINPYFGATIGRYANRIAGGRFEIDGSTFKLEKNFQGHQLHGGSHGFDKKIWQVIEVTEQDNTLRLFRKSAHLEEGYPGNLEVEVIFRLSEDNELSIAYKAIADRPTTVSLTNHTYFNLSGFKTDIENHIAQINSDQIISISDALDDSGVANNVQDTPLDLRQGVKLKRLHSMLNSGVDHYFVFNREHGPLKEVAEFIYPENGLIMRVETNAPGAQFYTATQLSDQLLRNENERYGPKMAFCFECHEFPNGPNLIPVRGRLNPGEIYEHQTNFHFLNQMLD